MVFKRLHNWNHDHVFPGSDKRNLQKFAGNIFHWNINTNIQICSLWNGSIPRLTNKGWVLSPDIWELRLVQRAQHATRYTIVCPSTLYADYLWESRWAISHLSVVTDGIDPDGLSPCQDIRLTYTCSFHACIQKYRHTFIHSYTHT